MAIYIRVRMCFLCSTFTPVFTGGFVLDVREGMKEVIAVEVTFYVSYKVLSSKWIRSLCRVPLRSLFPTLLLMSIAGWLMEIW